MTWGRVGGAWMSEYTGGVASDIAFCLQEFARCSRVELLGSAGRAA